MVLKLIVGHYSYFRGMESEVSVPHERLKKCRGELVMLSDFPKHRAELRRSFAAH